MRDREVITPPAEVPRLTWKLPIGDTHRVSNPNQTNWTRQWIWAGASAGRKVLAACIIALAFVLVLVSVGAIPTAGPVAPDSIVLYIAAAQVLLAALFRPKDWPFAVGLVALIAAALAYGVSYLPAYLPDMFGGMPAWVKTIGVPASQIAAAAASLVVILQERFVTPTVASSGTPAASGTSAASGTAIS